MLKKTITYTNLAEEEVTGEFYFNYTKLELLETDLKLEGLENIIKELQKTQDGPKAYSLFKQLILDAYGVPGFNLPINDDSFYKKDPITGMPFSRQFEASPACSEMIIEFLNDAALGAQFIEGCLPQKMVTEVKALQKEKTPEEIRAMVEEANRRQNDPATAVAPTVTEAPVAPPTVVKKASDYTREELLAMSKEEFERLAGHDPLKMDPMVLQVAFQRKNQGQ